MRAPVTVSVRQAAGESGSHGGRRWYNRAPQTATTAPNTNVRVISAKPKGRGSECRNAETSHAAERVAIVPPNDMTPRPIVRLVTALSRYRVIRLLRELGSRAKGEVEGLESPFDASRPGDGRTVQRTDESRLREDLRETLRIPDIRKAADGDRIGHHATRGIDDDANDCAMVANIGRDRHRRPAIGDRRRLILERSNRGGIDAVGWARQRSDPGAAPRRRGARAGRGARDGGDETE